MEHLSKSDIELLLEMGKGKPSISIYMPTMKGRERAKENSTRFKSLLNEAGQRLEKINMNTSELKELTNPAKKLISDSYFWANQSEGLAYFISLEFAQFYRLPLPFEEMAVVRKSFHLKPLFKLLSSDGLFYILALSQKNARLLRCTQSYVEEVDLREIIEKYKAEIGEELIEKHLQFHTGTPGIEGDRGAVYHGHGGEIDSIEREKLLNYFRFIDREIQSMLVETSAPLILACVDYLAPLYREVSKYSLLHKEIIKGNPEYESEKELQQKAWAIVRPFFREKEEEAKALYHEFKGTGKTSNNIVEILPAAYHGRVSELFVVPGIQQWGDYDQETERLSLSEEPQSGNEDLIDLAATKTFLTNGNVHVVELNQMPDSNPVAAVFRW
ncbi:MAG: hypothetical protein SCJ94_09985 [Bacillota bacterium]|nr:hypothetical protein [Bacillota bacterium]